MILNNIPNIISLKMKSILVVLVLVTLIVNCRGIDEIIERRIVPLTAPAGFSESGHYGTHFASRKTYFRSNTHVRYK